MKVLGYRVALIGWIGAGLCACGGAPGATSAPGSSEDSLASGSSISQPNSATDESEPDPPSAEASQPEPPCDEDPPAAQHPTGGVPPQNVASGAATCDCPEPPPPGVDIASVDANVDVMLTLPGDDTIVLTALTGNVATREHAVDVNGDVAVDLGGRAPVMLKDAQLHIETGSAGRLPSISGDATISGALVGHGCGCERDWLRASVDLDLGSDVTLAHAAALELELEMPKLSLSTADLPAGSSMLKLLDAQTVIQIDGDDELMQVTGQVAADAEAWGAMLPLEPSGDLQALVSFTGDHTTSVVFTGDAKLDGGSLGCGAKPLASVALGDAAITLDGAGAHVSATVDAAMHPSYRVSGGAQLRASFTPEDWSINVCGQLSTKLLLVSATTASCVVVSCEGATPCPTPDPGN